MNMKIVRSLFLLLCLLLLSFNGAAAQTYRFQLEQMEVQVYIHEDGTATIDYTMVFLNDGNADPIDFVDVGVPNSSYSISNVSAWIDDQVVTDIEASPYVTPGIAFGLGANAIPPGQRGTLQVRIESVRNMLFTATGEEQEPYTSFQFSPNYFGSQYVSGSTDLTVSLVLPPGIDPEEPRWFPPQRWPGEDEPISGMDELGRVYYTWTSDQANGSTAYIFGAAFPARLVPDNTINAPAGTTTQPGSDIFTGIFSNLFQYVCCCGIGFIILGSIVLPIYQATFGARKRKLKYLPPKIKVEGHGIKRGLTPVEAGILMEHPMDKILTMILFSAIKKGVASVVKRDPLELEVEETLPEDLRPYEKDFLLAFKETTKPKRREKLQETMTELVKSVSAKIKGFSRKETIEYYENIMQKAWAQVEAAETPEVRSEKYEEVMDWTMLDRKYDDRTREVFRDRPVFIPVWWGRYDPTYRPASPGRAASPTVAGPAIPSGTPLSRPTLPGSTFAATMVGGIQDFSSNVVGDLTSFTDRITNKTNPVPKVPSRPSSGGFRGGGGCACACACAGCACACAGGGR